MVTSYTWPRRWWDCASQTRTASSDGLAEGSSILPQQTVNMHWVLACENHGAITAVPPQLERVL
jgi:hypothetical protein